MQTQSTHIINVNVMPGETTIQIDVVPGWNYDPNGGSVRVELESVRGKVQVELESVGGKVQVELETL